MSRDVSDILLVLKNDIFRVSRETAICARSAVSSALFFSMMILQHETNLKLDARGKYFSWDYFLYTFYRFVRAEQHGVSKRFSLRCYFCREHCERAESRKALGAFCAEKHTLASGTREATDRAAPGQPTSTDICEWANIYQYTRYLK